MIMNLQNFKPMQGTAINLAKLIYPVYISTKVDGMRINRVGGSCRTKSLKPLGNVYTRELIESYPILEGIEGELTTTWDFGDAEAFNKATGDFRRFEGQPNVCLSIFDIVNEHPFALRYGRMQRLTDHLPSFARILPQQLVHNQDHLLAEVAHANEMGHEGIMIRQHDSLYKFGKSTIKGGELLKYKFLEDDEAIVVGVEEGMHNTNEKVTNELGRSKRSSSKEGLVPSGIAGAILGEHPKWGITKISGLKDDLAEDLLKNFEKYRGLLVTFRYQAHGTMEAPRQAKFKGFRDPNDMSLPNE